MTSPNRFAIIGNPLDHSLSPAMHNAAFRVAGIDARYEAFPLDSRDLPRGVRQLRHEGYTGFNVTIPHKESILNYLDEIDRDAADIGAVNTVVQSDGILKGHNTDITGFERALESLHVDLVSLKAVVFGAGGAARAVVHALLRLGGQVTLVNRDRERARRLARQAVRPVDIRKSDDPALLEAIERASLLVNATPLGMGHLAERSPLPPDGRLIPGTTVLDLVYGHRTPFLNLASLSGCRTMDGLEMLVQQGAESFRLWTRVGPDIEVMRQACLAQLQTVERCSVS